MRNSTKIEIQNYTIKKIKEHNKTYKGKIRGIKDNEGKMTQYEEGYKKVWAEYFKKLLIDCEQDGIEEEVGELGELIEEPKKEGIKELINRSRNEKALGCDGINMELIKYGVETLLDRIFKLVTNIWKEEKIPEEWSKDQIVTIHKKRDQQQLCKN